MALAYDQGVPTEALRKTLIFSIDSTLYAISVADVREIVGMQRITSVPGSVHYVRGVMNLRGKVVPVMDVRSRFGLPPRQLDSLENPAISEERTCVIVVRARGAEVGLSIDTVEEVMDIPESNIEASPHLAGSAAPYVVGIAKIRDSVIVILGAEELLFDDAMSFDMGMAAA